MLLFLGREGTVGGSLGFLLGVECWARFILGFIRLVSASMQTQLSSFPFRFPFFLKTSAARSFDRAIGV